MATLENKVSAVVGDRTAKVLDSTFSIKSVGDLMRHYPRRYMVRGELSDISVLREGDETTILAQIYAVNKRPLRGGKGSILEVVVTDGTDKLSLTFFNQAWREKDLKIGRQGLFAGKVGVFNNKKQLAHPDYELIPDGSDVDSAVEGFAGKYLPVYPASAKLPSWKISQCAQLAIGALDEIADFLPETIRAKHDYPSLHQALVQLHQPADLDHAENARERLTFDEAFLLQSLLVLRRIELKKLNSTSRKATAGGLLDAFDNRLPFQLTAGQVAVCKEIESDLAQPHPMHRLLQGEVGSGKTIVALRAMLAVVDSGGQAALLAPTEVLAAQHLRTIQRQLGTLAQGGMLGGSDKGTQITLITGSQSAQARREALAKAADGSAGIVIGTHALLGESVVFKDLGLIVVDEQHRFGVAQRARLWKKATVPPHILVMTATPIPRTLAMTAYGDLDYSVIDELPPGRKPIQTVHRYEKDRSRVMEFIRSEVAKGRQVYIIYPLIEESAKLDYENLMKGYEEVKAFFPEPNYWISMVHGRQPAVQKETNMQRFVSGDTQIMVATTVIEVGVNVPNASVMLIESAEKFGLSQLHQLRGRVGRGAEKSYCVLLTPPTIGKEARERMKIMTQTSSGFEIAEKDLLLRGPGEIEGTRQSGALNFRLADIMQDRSLLETASQQVTQLLDKDPTLVSPENQPLRLYLQQQKTNVNWSKIS